MAKTAQPPAWFPSALVWLFPWVVGNLGWMLLALAPAIVVTNYVEAWIERRVELPKLLNEILARMRPYFMPAKLRQAPPADHRLTLFRAGRGQKRLDILARSGEATPGSRRRWRIHPDNKAQCEGVAGVGWYIDSVMTVPSPQESELPDISTAGVASDDDIADYAQRTFVTADQVREDRWSARSFATITIRVDGRRWGVLVLDSVAPKGADLKRIKEMVFAADVLADIIKAWGER